ncbi:MAG: type I-A CRISPR-associated protein Csa5 [Nitrososphaerota archaeon]|nr:type I-A CRISPR-associated protein Csa5 [Candidatus Geocrenenecus dongiae]
MSLNIRKYHEVAVALASVGIYTGSYSIIDRIANALGPESVIRAIYENGRILESALRASKSSKDEWIRISENSVIVKRKDEEKAYVIRGSLPTELVLREFLEESSKNITIGRAVASYAMHLIASAVSHRAESESEKEGEE